MNEKFVNSIKKGAKFILFWKFMKAEVWSSKNDDGTLTAEGIYIPLETKIAKELMGKLVNLNHK